MIFRGNTFAVKDDKPESAPERTVEHKRQEPIERVEQLAAEQRRRRAASPRCRGRDAPREGRDPQR